MCLSWCRSIPDSLPQHVHSQNVHPKDAFCYRSRGALVLRRSLNTTREVDRSAVYGGVDYE